MPNLPVPARGTTPSRVPLSRARILQAALALADEGGVEAVSIPVADHDAAGRAAYRKGGVRCFAAQRVSDVGHPGALPIHAQSRHPIAVPVTRQRDAFDWA